VAVSESPKLITNQISAGEEKWLVEKINYFFNQAEQAGTLPSWQIDELYVLIGALKVLGLDGAAQSFMPRLSEIKKRAG